MRITMKSLGLQDAMAIITPAMVGLEGASVTGHGESELEAGQRAIDMFLRMVPLDQVTVADVQALQFEAGRLRIKEDAPYGKLYAVMIAWKEA